MAMKYMGNGKWVQIYDKTTNSSSSRPSTTSNKTSSSSKKNTSTSKKNTTTSKKTTSTVTTPKTKEVERNILRGSLSVVPNPNYRAKKTVLLQYLGKNVTGLYFVDSVVHTFSSGGYSQTIDVSKTGFKESIKEGNSSKKVGQATPSQGSLITSNSTRPSTNTPKPTTPNKGNSKPSSNSTNSSTQKGEVPVNKWGVVTPKIGLNIRKDPSTKNPRITAMPKGSKVFCVSKKNGWYKVEWKTKSKTYKGWSEGSYIKLNK